MVPTPTARTAPTPTEPTARTRTEPTAQPEHGFEQLAVLLGGGNPEQFLDQQFGRAAFRARLTPEVRRRLFDWARLNAALAEHRLAPPRLRLEQSGRDVTRGLFRERRTQRGSLMHDLDVEVLNQRLRDGATLIVDAVNEMSPPLQRLCAGLGAEFTASCQANLYACWGTTQGFDVHWDDHEVFVVHLEGRKRWALYGMTTPWPTRRTPGAAGEPPEGPPEEIELEPGDVLYLPRGYWHAAVGLGGPTLHLTIGLTRKTGADFLHWLADHAAASSSEVRADLPLERPEAELGRRLAAVMSKLAAEDPERLGRLYRRHLESRFAQRPQLSFPAVGGDEVLPAPPATRLRLAHGASHLDTAPTGEALLSWRGVVFTTHGALTQPLRRLVQGRSVTIAELQSAAGPAAHLVHDFVAQMVGRGVFVLEPCPA